MAGDGSLTNCATTPGSYPRNMALAGGYAYIAGGSGTVESCAINGDGTLTDCNAYTVLSGEITVAIEVAGKYGAVPRCDELFNRKQV